MPNVQVKLDKLKGKRLFTKFDVCAGYNNILIEPEDTHKAAFKTPLGTYVPKVMTFSLSNAPSVFQWGMYQDLRPLLLKYPDEVANLIDNWCISTDDTPKGQQWHCEITHFMLDLFELHSYFLKPSKCAFEQDHVTFLGFQIHTGCAWINLVKMDGIWTWPEIFKSKKEIRQFLGVVGYQCPFIRNFAKLALALTTLLKDDTPWPWGEEQTLAVQLLKKAVCDDPELVAPDLSKPFELQTDASAFALGATLFQLDDWGKKHMVGAASHTLTETERNYDVWDREFMGFVYSLLHWWHLLAGTTLPVQVFINHVNLTHYCHPQKINRHVAWYINSLSEFNYILKHLPGTLNHADGLSQRPNYDDGSNDNKQVVALPDHVFIHSISVDSLWGRVAAA